MPKGPTYWLDLFSYDTWNEFLAAGGTITGFSEHRWTTVQKIKRGDIFLCYITGVSRWIGLLEVTGPPFRDTTPIWSAKSFPARLPVKLLVALDIEAAVPILSLKNELSIFQNLQNPHAWTGRLRGSPQAWSKEDGETVAKKIWEAKQNPERRSVDPKKLKRQSPYLKPGDVADRNQTLSEDGEDELEVRHEVGEEQAHTEIQWRLLNLGVALGQRVWVAKDDRSKSYQGNDFRSLRGMASSLPAQFDPRTQDVIERIDVLWLDGNSISAAFEIERTTSVYSGLLRMSDLSALQPNLKIPLYLVAPEARRNKVFKELVRPTFDRRPVPLRDICRYISFENLRDHVEQSANFIRYMRPEMIEEIAEPVELPDDDMD